MSRKTTLSRAGTALALIFSSAAFAECQYGGNDIVELGPVEPPIGIGPIDALNMVDAWGAIAEDLAPLGDQMKDWEGRVVVHAMVWVLWEPVESSFHVDKLCGETFEEMARRVQQNASQIMNGDSGAGTGDSSGSGGGSGGVVVYVVRWAEEWRFTCTLGGVPIPCGDV